MPIDTPIEIKDSLDRFARDHREPTKTAFIMIDYEETKPHDEIVGAIKDALKSHGMEGVLAKDNPYHDNLEYNVLTYLHGCGFGIAVFERIVNDDFNPNVSFEVGYMLALRKPICYLKDRTLRDLQSDIGGKIYYPFDTYNPAATIQDAITKWLPSKGLATPLTRDGFITYARSIDSGIPWEDHLYLYDTIKQLRVNTMEQLKASIEDPEAREVLNRIYANYLKRLLDPIGILAWQPILFFRQEGRRIVEAAIRMSPEFRGLTRK
jgi:hypothetical protein